MRGKAFNVIDAYGGSLPTWIGLEYETYDSYCIIKATFTFIPELENDDNYIGESLTILDFDDTLFPTSRVAGGVSYGADEYGRLDIEICDLCNAAVSLGIVWVISLASPTWLKSCMRKLPRFQELVRKGCVNLYSARNRPGIDRIMRTHVDTDWKMPAKRESLISILSSHPKIKRITCVGDQRIDIDFVLDAITTNGRVFPSLDNITSVLLRPERTLSEIIPDVRCLGQYIFWFMSQQSEDGHSSYKQENTSLDSLVGDAMCTPIKIKTLSLPIQSDPSDFGSNDSEGSENTPRH